MSDKKQEIVDCIDSVIELLEDMRDMLDSKEPDAARGFFEASEDAFLVSCVEVSMSPGEHLCI
jgi:hypothetical protein